MAWRCHGVDNADLVRQLERHGILKSARVANAMRACDRGNYAPTSSRDEAYEDHPLPIGYRATISAPHAHAACWNSSSARASSRGKKSLGRGKRHRVPLGVFRGTGGV